MITWQNHILELPDKLKDNPKLLTNCVWRLENLYPIRNREGVLIPFKMNCFQAEIVNRLIENISNNDYSPIVILKSRQVGISTLAVIFALDLTLFYEGRRSVILSAKQKSVDDIFEIAQTSFRSMYGFSDGVDRSSINQSINEKQGRIDLVKQGSFLTSRLEIRGLPGVNFCHYSEYAFTELARLQATAGSLGPNTIKIIESTPFGLNHFHSLYEENKEKNPQNTFFFPWHRHKEYRRKVSKNGLGDLTKEEKLEKKQLKLTDQQLQFKRDKMLEMRSIDDQFSSFKQEFASDDVSCFLKSGAGVIDPEILMDLKNQTENKKPVEDLWDGDTQIKVFKKIDWNNNPYPNKYWNIYCGCDPSEGVGWRFFCCNSYFSNRRSYV